MKDNEGMHAADSRRGKYVTSHVDTSVDSVREEGVELM
jgi:hypothetical protein